MSSSSRVSTWLDNIPISMDDMPVSVENSRQKQSRSGKKGTFEVDLPQRSMPATYSASTDGSRSPSQQLADTQLSDTPIVLVSLTPTNVPPQMQALFEDVQEISQGVKIIPRSVESKMNEIGVNVREIQFADEEQEFQTSEPGILDPLAFWERVYEIQGIAAECGERGVSKATWNSEVHSSLLRLALQCHYRAKGTWYQDMTSARISDKTLLPFTKVATNQSKLLDYALVIDWNEGLKRRIIRRLNDDPTPPSGQVKSINCTSTNYIRFSPIAIIIKAKRPDSHVSADLHLGTWAIAHLRKLMRLTNNNNPADLPVLPMVFINGHEWYLMFARLTTSELKIFGRVQIGDTWELKGTYKIIASIRRLAQWIEEDYRPWFEESVLSDRGELDDAT